MIDMVRAGGQKPEEDEEALVGSQLPWGVTYQIFCMSDAYIKIHNSSKMTVMK